MDIEILEESALAQAQSLIQNAFNESKLSQVELAKRLNVSKERVNCVLHGNYNLTVKTLQRYLVACGFEIKFEKRKLDE